MKTDRRVEDRTEEDRQTRGRENRGRKTEQRKTDRRGEGGTDEDRQKRGRQNSEEQGGVTCLSVMQYGRSHFMCRTRGPRMVGFIGLEWVDLFKYSTSMKYEA